MSYTREGQFDQEQLPKLAKGNAEPPQGSLQGTTLGRRPNNSIEKIHAAGFVAVSLKNLRAIYGLLVGLP